MQKKGEIPKIVIQSNFVENTFTLVDVIKIQANLVITY